MTRPVEGFLAKDGTFFESEAKCQFYEASVDVRVIVLSELRAFGFADDALDRLTNAVVAAVLNFRDPIHSFITASYSVVVNVPKPEAAQEASTGEAVPASPPSDGVGRINIPLAEEPAAADQGEPTDFPDFVNTAELDEPDEAPSADTSAFFNPDEPFTDGSTTSDDIRVL